MLPCSFRYEWQGWTWIPLQYESIMQKFETAPELICSCPVTKIIKIVHFKRFWKTRTTNIYIFLHTCKVSCRNNICDALCKNKKQWPKWGFENIFLEYWCLFFCIEHHKCHLITEICTYIEHLDMFMGTFFQNFL